ncbi:hypothetical protein [Kangiella sp. M94]
MKLKTLTLMFILLLAPLVCAAETNGDDCKRLAKAASWIAWAGYSENTNLETVKESVADIDAASDIFENLPWTSERLEVMISEILYLNKKITPNENEQKRAFLVGEYYQIRCTHEGTGTEFLSFAKSKDALQSCLKNENQNKAVFEECILTKTVQ